MLWVLLFFCCAPQTLHAQNSFDPFATEFPPEIERSQMPSQAPSRQPKNTPQKSIGNDLSKKNELRPKRKNKSTTQTRRRKILPAKIEQPEPSYISGSLDFKVDVGLEHNFFLSVFEPSLDFAELTDDQLRSEFISFEEILYPSLKIRGGRGLVIHARPALSALSTRYRKKSGSQGVATLLNADASESFVSITPSGRFSLQVGQQNFQWGLAELGSPSNWIFRSDRLGEYFTKSPQSRVETRDLVKVGLSVGQSLSVIALAEYEAQERERPQVYQGRRVAMKGEFSWNDAASSIGFVLGGAERQNYPFFGEYFSLSIGDAFTFYGDASHMKGSPVVKPVLISVGDGSSSQRLIAFDQPFLSSEKIEHDVILGFKYTFVNGLEMRAEGAYSSVGLTRDELSLVSELERLSSPLVPLFFLPGVELRSESAVFLGLKRVGFGKGGRWTLLGRYFVPISDRSGGAFGYGEYLFSDNSVLFFSAGGYHGSAISQAAFPRRWSFSMGQKYVW